MLKGSFGVSEQPETIKDIETNKKLTDLLKLTRIIFKPKGIVIVFRQKFSIFFNKNH